MRTQYTVPLEAGKYYHVYNRGNNGQQIFFSNENYRYFLLKIDDYCSDFMIIHAFILLQNHFHLLVEIKKENEIIKEIKRGERYAKLRKFIDGQIETILSKQFQYFFICYSKSINKEMGRHGSLFEKPFRRKLITTDNQYRNVMYYIHRNMLHHHLPIDFRDYSWSTYSKILEQRPSKLPKQRILNLFDSTDNFIRYHEQERDLNHCTDDLIDYYPEGMK